MTNAKRVGRPRAVSCEKRPFLKFRSRSRTLCGSMAAAAVASPAPAPASSASFAARLSPAAAFFSVDLVASAHAQRRLLQAVHAVPRGALYEARARCAAALQVANPRAGVAHALRRSLRRS